jgi:hypothetical protein
VPTSSGVPATKVFVSIGVTESASGLTTQRVLPSGESAKGLETLATPSLVLCNVDTGPQLIKQKSKPSLKYLIIVSRPSGLLR